jgi:hypothetical protein
MSIYNASGVMASGGGGNLHAVWPQLRAVSAYQDANTSTVTGAISSPNAGDLILAWVYMTNATDGAVPTAPAGEGWTRAVTVEDTGGTNANASLFWKYWGVSGNTDNASPVFSGGGSMACVCETWKNVRSSGAIHVTATTHGAGGTTVTPADASSTAAERVSVSVFMGGQTAAGNISSLNGPNYVQTAAGSSYATTAGPDRAVALERNENITLSGSVAANGTTGTFTVANTAWAAITVILRGP